MGIPPRPAAVSRRLPAPKARKNLNLVFVGTIAILAMLFAAYRAAAAPASTTPPAAAVERLEATASAFAQVAAAVKPAVVNIATTKKFNLSGRRPHMEPFFEDPFFRHFFGDPRRKPPRERRQRSLGSGVIVAADGVIVTNNHVVAEADEILVRLSDGREFTGKVLGSDPKTDLAVIRIDATELPSLSMGDSSQLEVGHLVMAVGNPFGLNQTVTMGIVSAKGRANVGIADYEDFIQTDVAINPGNSGGAMVNMRGELVGVNTAIFSTSGGYQGIGFAVPTSIVQPVVASLIDTGKVVRGWLGVMIQTVTPDLAEQFSLDEATGVLVGDVVKESPAEKGGFKRGDIILSFEGSPVDDPAHIRNRIAATSPGTKARFEIVRNGKHKTITVELGELPGDLAAAAPGAEPQTDNAFSGLTVGEITPVIREQLKLPEDLSGVVLRGLDDDAPAARVLHPGDVIMEINRMQIDDMDDFRKAVTKLGENETALVLVYRKGSTLFFTISKGS